MKNRCLITTEEIKGQEYLISALYDEHKKMVEVTPVLKDKASILGNIYIGRVENVVKNLNAAFIKIGPGQNAYYSLDECENAIFTKKLSDKKPLVAGDELLVQVEREAIKTKEPQVTSNLTFSGTYAVLTTGNRNFSVSSKLGDETRKFYRASLEEYFSGKEHNFGIIVRTNAKNIATEQLFDEIDSLQQTYEDLLETSRHKTCYSCLKEAVPLWVKQVEGLREDTLEEILTDDEEIFSYLMAHYNRLPVHFYEDPMVSLSSLYSVKANLKEALQQKVWLRSGAYLLIEPTETLTVIDINTGKNVAKKNAQENFLNVNLEAAKEIARQLRLRNISGMILVDFVNLESKEANDTLLQTFRNVLKEDPVPTKLVDMTKLRLVEVTRKKVKKSLREAVKFD